MNVCSVKDHLRTAMVSFTALGYRSQVLTPNSDAKAEMISLKSAFPLSVFHKVLIINMQKYKDFHTFVILFNVSEAVLSQHS